MRTWILVLGGALAAVLGWALWLPAEHSVSGTAEFETDLAAVWDVYTDSASQPQWRSEVGSIEFTDETGAAWIETVNPGAVAVSDHGVTGTFAETSVALRLVPKIMRAPFVDGQALIERYSEQARAEIRRRAAGPGS